MPHPPVPQDQPLRSLGPGLEAPQIGAALQGICEDPEVAEVRLSGSRWHVLGHIHREGVPLHAA
jgi:hypothetical protein